MRDVTITVGARQISMGKTWAYPDGEDEGEFRIPTYSVTVSGTDDAGASASREFEAFRFGVQKKGKFSPRVVGLSQQQTHVIKAWLPHYSVHSAPSTERGAWQVYANFLIHDGPDDPRTEVYASIGCVEICNGPRGFDQFNDFIISLAGSSAHTRDLKLRQIGAGARMKITYVAAPRPALAKW